MTALVALLLLLVFGGIVWMIVSRHESQNREALKRTLKEIEGDKPNG